MKDEDIEERARILPTPNGKWKLVVNEWINTGDAMHDTGKSKTVAQKFDTKEEAKHFALKHEITLQN